MFFKVVGQLLADVFNKFRSVKETLLFEETLFVCLHPFANCQLARTLSAVVVHDEDSSFPSIVERCLDNLVIETYLLKDGSSDKCVGAM